MAYQVTAVYSQPADPAAFDEHYNTTHLQIARRLPDLQSLTVSRPGPAPDGAPAPYYLIAVLTYADQAAADASLGGPVGQEAIADLPTFAGAGVEIVSGPSETIV